MTPEAVIAEANCQKFVGLALFKNEYRLREVVDIFAAIDVKGLAMLKNCRFFEHTPHYLREGIKMIKMLYRIDYFNPSHLSQLRSILERGKLVKTPHVAVRSGTKGLWSQTGGLHTDDNPIQSTYLLTAGFKYSDFVDCRAITEISEDAVRTVVETRSELFSANKLANASDEQRLKLINLLQYFAEKEEARIFRGGKEEYDDNSDADEDIDRDNSAS